MSDSKVNFKASIAPILTGIKVDGSGGGMRIQLDIPESEMSKAAWLLAMRESVLNVTIEVDDGKNPQESAKKRAKF